MSDLIIDDAGDLVATEMDLGALVDSLAGSRCDGSAYRAADTGSSGSHHGYYGMAEYLEAEIAKCDVVCANCHRLRTHRQRDHAATCMAGGKARPPP